MGHAKGCHSSRTRMRFPEILTNSRTLVAAVPEMETLIGNTIEWLPANNGYRGHHAIQLQVQGIHRRPEVAGDGQDQTRTAPAVRHRTGSRSSQIRALRGPLLPQVPREGRCQCNSRRGRLQLLQPDPVPQSLAAPNPRPCSPSNLSLSQEVRVPAMHKKNPGGFPPGHSCIVCQTSRLRSCAERGAAR